MYFVGFQLLLLMHILTTDRLLSVLNPIRYTIYMPRCRMKKVIFVSWLISFVLGIIRNVVDGIRFPMLCVTIVIALLYIVLVLVTYSVIIFKLRKSRQQFNPATRNQLYERIKFKKEYLVPTVIIVSFVMFYVIPTVLLVSVDLTYTTYQCIMITFSLGCVADALAYVFMTKYYRSVIAQACCICHRQALPSVATIDIALEHVTS